jgi:hypothetical protein
MKVLGPLIPANSLNSGFIRNLAGLYPNGEELTAGEETERPGRLKLG